ncbi:MAG TPA: thiamine pyrophosphate-dependent enzyme [Alphaproteobacteria bacterium]|nr:thiamine pyrophosphate-dependent enzyme [Alphaproteobacteria bacterium]
MTKRNGGEILVAALTAHGVDRAFGVPGESALPLYDALLGAANRIQFVTCRHEASAAHMAEADGRMRGGPGVCMVSRGPGAMHAAIGVHTAQQNSGGLVLLVGQVQRAERGREAFQEMNYEAVFGGMTKWTAEIDDTAKIPEMIAKAFQIAASGRPGPVVLSLPEDILDELSDAPDVAPLPIERPAPSAADMAKLQALLQRAERPILIIGGPGWTPEAAEDIKAFAAANELPMVCAFRSQGIVDDRCENFVGDLGFGVNPKLGARIKNSDLLIAVGDRLCDASTQGYSLIVPPKPVQPLIHIYPGKEELGRVFESVLPIHSGVVEAAAALKSVKIAPPAAWKEARLVMRAELDAYRTPGARRGAVDMARVVSFLGERLPENAIVANGAGNYCIWVHRYYRYRGFGTQAATKGGAMGYGFPAAIAAKLRYPERPVVVFAGDGCFTMAMAELATVAQQKLPLVILVVNNGIYGAIRFHQEIHFPGRVSGTDLQNPDFAALARSFGLFGEIVEDDADFPAAFDRAIASGGPALIELRTDAEHISPDKTIADLRALQKA